MLKENRDDISASSDFEYTSDMGDESTVETDRDVERECMLETYGIAELKE